VSPYPDRWNKSSRAQYPSLPEKVEIAVEGGDERYPRLAPAIL